MAKLSAHGRVKVAQICRERQTDDLHTVTHRALMSDGVILKKVNFLKDGRVDHSTGWKQGGKLKPGLKPRDVVDQWVDTYLRNGWERVII